MIYYTYFFESLAPKRVGEKGQRAKGTEKGALWAISGASGHEKGVL